MDERRLPDRADGHRDIGYLIALERLMGTIDRPTLGAELFSGRVSRPPHSARQQRSCTTGREPNWRS